MSVQEPAFSFGAPGGASWAAARSGEDTGESSSRISNAAAPLTRFILTRTRGSPLPRCSLYSGAAGGGRGYFAREGLTLPPRRPPQAIDIVGLLGRFTASTIAAAMGWGYA